MNKNDFIKQRNDLLKQKKAFELKINKAYTKIHNQFVKANSPVEKLKVYKLIKEGIRRRGFSRFVIYTLKVSWLGDSPIITAVGWWLDQDSVPKKCDSMSVYGVSNPTVFELAEDQTNLPHPCSEKQNGQ